MVESSTAGSRLRLTSANRTASPSGVAVGTAEEGMVVGTLVVRGVWVERVVRVIRDNKFPVTRTRTLVIQET